MQKLTILCMASARDQALAALQDLGVVHLSHIQPPRGQNLEDARARLAHVERALHTLPRHRHAKPSGRAGSEIVDDIWAFIHEKKRLTEERDALVQERTRVAPCGSFDPAAIHALAGKGIFVRLFKMPASQALPACEDAAVQELHRDKTHVWFAVISRTEVAVDAEAVRLPAQSLADIDAAIEACDRQLAENQKRLDVHANDRDVVAAHCRGIADQVHYTEALTGMGSSQAVSYLQGFCPEDGVEQVRAAAASNGWAVLAEAPAEEDEAPTLIRNPKWVKLIQPIMDFVGILPGYREVDISPLFLVFFSVFFGMIVGDAGYGAIFLVMALLGPKLWPQAPRVIFSMLTLMSLCTIAWGALTGSYFGMAPQVLAGPLQGIPVLSNANPKSADNVMLICFLIGAVHLTIAHGWNVVRKMPSMEAVGDLGWLLMTWVMFFGARTMILLQPFPPVMSVVFGVAFVCIGASLIFPLSRLKARAINLITFPLDIVSNFVDVVSYVRLFAVGMATYAVASAFNEMGLNIGFGGILSGLGAALIIFFGHTLNIALAVMGVLVHGIRLNTLEFSGHLGMEWTGVPYQPFARKADKDD